MNHKILVVDDEPANTRMLERVLRNDFDVITAQSGAEGLELLMIHDVALIVSDQRMPGMTGVEFLKRSAELRPNCVRIILTGYTDVADLVDALNSNVVYKFVTKPWVTDDLLQTIKRGLSHHETVKAQHRLMSENKRLRERMKVAEDAIIKVCSEMLSVLNAEFRERADRVRDMSVMIGKAMELDSAMLDTLASTSLLQGLADIYVDRSFTTPGMQLNADIEFRRERGLDLIADLPSLQEVVVAIRYLTENYDGSGPAGLSGSQIPLASRIVAAVKAFEAMMVPNSGDGDALSVEEAVEQLQSMSSRRFDPKAIEALASRGTVDRIRTLFPDLVTSAR